MASLVVSAILAIAFAICLGFIDLNSKWYVHIYAVYKIIVVCAVFEAGFHASAFFRMPKVLAKSTMFAYCFHPFVLSIIIYPIIDALSPWYNVITSLITFLSLQL